MQRSGTGNSNPESIRILFWCLVCCGERGEQGGAHAGSGLTPGPADLAALGRDAAAARAGGFSVPPLGRPAASRRSLPSAARAHCLTSAVCCQGGRGYARDLSVNIPTP